VWSFGAVCLNDAKYDDEKLCGALHHHLCTDFLEKELQSVKSGRILVVIIGIHALV
jgi:hypothetical protein